MRKVILDANVLISVLNHDRATSEEQYRTAKSTLESLLRDDSVGIVLTPLVRHEVMRGVPRSDLSKIEKIRALLDGFETISITDEISEVATTIFRIIKEQDANNGIFERVPSKLGFDIMHVATAHVYDLDIISNDPDIDRLKSILDVHKSDFV